MDQEPDSASPHPLKLTPTDRLILNLLEQDARRTVSEMAAMLGVSRTTVKDRIDLMRERRVIRRFTIEVANTEQEQSIRESAFFLLRLKRNVCRIVHGSIRGWPELLGCWSIAGDLDMVVLIAAPSMADIERLRDKLARHPEVNRLQTLTILRDWVGETQSIHPKAAQLLNEIEGVAGNEFVRL